MVKTLLMNLVYFQQNISKELSHLILLIQHTPENKNSEKLVKDLRNTLNKFWKQHDIPFKIR